MSSLKASELPPISDGAGLQTTRLDAPPPLPEIKLTADKAKQSTVAQLATPPGSQSSIASAETNSKQLEAGNKPKNPDRSPVNNETSRGCDQDRGSNRSKPVDSSTNNKQRVSCTLKEVNQFNKPQFHESAPEHELNSSSDNRDASKQEVASQSASDNQEATLKSVGKSGEISKRDRASFSASSGTQKQQMFSLKHLTIHSKNLARKRNSIQTGEARQVQRPLANLDGPTASRVGSTLARLLEGELPRARDNRSKSGNKQNTSSSDNSSASDDGPRKRRQTSPAESEPYVILPPSIDGIRGKIRTRGSEKFYEADDYDDDDDNDDDDDDDDEEEDEEEEEEDEDEEEDESSGSQDEDGDIENSDEKVQDDEDDNDIKKKSPEPGRRNKKRGFIKRRRPLERRASHCDCEPFITRLDYDGLPVTDVDLVSYKDLCQMEQQAHNMRTNHRRQRPLEAHSLQVYGLSSANLRRSSLQEESGAYYQLCTTGDEQLIRQKYAWYPPSLRQLALVEQFFSDYPADKIPLAGIQPSIKVQASSGDRQSRDHQISGRGNNLGTKHPAASSYRDEQISFQLPRQDISLDYCSYPMSESSRSAYLQFVDKRNSQALDVASVVQVRLSSQSTASGGRHYQACQRKASTASQSSSLVKGLPTAGGGGVSTSTGVARCRRCLVRFEDKQLAVAAPNFIIGSAIYRQSPTIPGACRRRASSAAQQEGPFRLGAAPEPQVALFHPTCFSCSTCRELLVDLVYCLRDNKLYCLRHYGESLRPRCSWCRELIFSDEYLKAMNESFHVDHFLCRHCDANLAGQRYVLKDDKPSCVQCYEANFANTCEDCQKPIGIDSRDLSYKERHWHDTCFVCNKCQQSLIDKPFGSKGEKVYCADCYDVSYATRCDGCKNPFRAGSKKMEYRGKQWHDSCFCCCACRNTIGSNSFIPKNDEIYCIKCYEDKFATRCTKCKQVIVAGGVTFRNEPWHRDCFTCCHCNKSLAGQRFTTRDANADPTSETKSGQLHNAYCIDCYGQLFAKKCFACSQAITGLGGTRFVTFEERSWHNDCFICNDCQTSLVGKGFITDGPEAILCSECARAKLR